MADIQQKPKIEDDPSVLEIYGNKLVSTSFDGGAVVITADVPLSEMFGYATDMRSATQGRATYTMEFSRYEKAPRSVEEEIVAKATGKKLATA